MAISKVRHDIGNPLQYLTWSGLNSVKSAMRNAISKGVYYQCSNCGNIGQLRRRDDIETIRLGRRAFKCSRCNSEEVETYQLTTFLDRWDIPIQDKTKFRLYLQEFKTTLTTQEMRVLDLILAGYDREASKNYLRDIAQQLKVSPQRISACVKRIRIKYSDYFNN